MKKFIILILVTIFVFTIGLTGCKQELPDEIKTQIVELKAERENLKLEVDNSTKELNTIKDQIKVKQDKLGILDNVTEGKLPKYVFTLELKQTHFSLDIGKHIKDAINKCTFDIYVDEELYNSQKVGGELLKKFRSGSLFLEGSIGDWVITVIDKKVIYV